MSARCEACGALLSVDGTCSVCLLGLGLDRTETREVRPEESHNADRERIGPYTILEVLGQGGMGIVYLAEQTRPIRRRVALKLIKPGMDSGEVIARFESERQALALMNHPNVAKVLDAGVSEDGRPYFVMEYVRGVPITEHCNRHRLTTRERLGLFIRVCEGVQHAHQKTIVHRDLKPSNILVAVEEDETVPKIIDFGVAKATGQKLTEQTLQTRQGVILGTPEYMSPEQAELSGQDIDTRSDVYSLGMLLYVLLVGALPFDPGELRQAGFDEIRRRIREDEPPKPTSRLGTLGEHASTESARERRVDVPTLRRELAGDLDWITMKALEKDRSRRYGSPAELAADLERHLTDQPVLAGPPSLSYRARKFVRRNRIGVGVAAAALLVLLAFAGAMTWQARRIAIERDRANHEALAATQALDFLTGIFKVSDPSEARGNSISAREILDRGAKRLAKELAGDRLTQARMMMAIGTVYKNLGLYEQAAPLLEDSLSSRRRLLGNDHVATLESLNSLGTLLLREGKLKEAEPYLREALERRRRVLGNDHPDTLESINRMDDLLTDEARFKEAEPLAREALEGQRRILGNDHPDTLDSINEMSQLLLHEGKLDQAEAYAREALETSRRVNGDDHPHTLTLISNLSRFLEEQGKLDQAEAYAREALEGRRRVLGNDHPDTLMSILNVGWALVLEGKLAEAETYNRDALEGYRRVLGDDHPTTLQAIHNLAALLRREGKYDEALRFYREAFEGRRRVLGDDNPYTMQSLNRIGLVLHRQGKLKEAEPYLRDTLEHSRRVNGSDHPDTLEDTASLADLYLDQRRLQEAERILKDAVPGARRLPSGNRIAGELLNSNGRWLTLMKRYEDAEAALLEAQKILSVADAVLSQEAKRNLAALYQAWGKPDKAAAWRESNH